MKALNHSEDYYRFFRDLQYRMQLCRVLAKKWWWDYVWRKDNIMIFKTDYLDKLTQDGKAILIVDCLHREVITILLHPKKGKTYFSRGNISMSWLESFFRNPRSHTHGLPAHYLTMQHVNALLQNVKVE